jgi:iron(III) transport system ATP-binding protein
VKGTEGATLELDGLTRRFGEVIAVDDVSLSISEGEFLTLLGPSGCGKTTALRLIAGFETPDVGRVRFRGDDVTGWSPQKRGFGMVFQNYALFPHLDVGENVAFGLRSRRRPRPEIRERVERALERVSLPGLADRAVQALSGGQQQRVALARALAIQPPLLLLDEPFSNLDADLRERTRTELRLLIKELEITAVFVTHDQEEAFDLSDRIAVMSEGRLRQVGSPDELYRRPADLFVAGFVGRSNALSGTLEVSEEGRTRVRLEAGPVWSLGGGGDEAPRPGPCRVLVRPEDLVFTGPDAEGVLRGRVRDRRFLGTYTRFFLDTESAGVLEVVRGEHGPEVGESVGVAPASRARLHVFPGGSDADASAPLAPHSHPRTEP